MIRLQAREKSGYGRKAGAIALRILQVQDEIEAGEMEQQLAESLKQREEMRRKQALARREESEKSGKPQPTQPQSQLNGQLQQQVRPRSELKVNWSPQVGQEDSFDIDTSEVPPETGQRANVIDLVRHMVDEILLPDDWGLDPKLLPDRGGETFEQPVCVQAKYQPGAGSTETSWSRNIGSDPLAKTIKLDTMPASTLSWLPLWSQ